MIKIVNLIIPCYNALDCLSDALDSVVAQTKKMFLVTIVQDGDGLDYTPIIKRYRERGLKIRYLICEQNGGAGVARQVAMDYDAEQTPSCDYYMFLDADDALLPNAVETLSEEIQRTKNDIVIGSFLMQDKGITRYIPSAETPVTWMPCKIYRAEYLRQNNIRFLPDIRYNEDSYFNLVAVNCTEKVSRIDVPIFLWKENPNSVTRSIDENGNFFTKSNAQYILTQVRGLKEIYNHVEKIDPAVLGQTMIYIYESMMRQRYERLEDYSYIDELLTLKDFEPLQEFYKNPGAWDSTIANLQPGRKMEDGNYFFYDITFIKWAQKFILADPKNIEEEK